MYDYLVFCIFILSRACAEGGEININSFYAEKLSYIELEIPGKSPSDWCVFYLSGDADK